GVGDDAPGGCGCSAAGQVGEGGDCAGELDEPAGGEAAQFVADGCGVEPAGIVGVWAYGGRGERQDGVDGGGAVAVVAGGECVAERYCDCWSGRGAAVGEYGQY